jgi:hypothetical protein
MKRMTVFLVFVLVVAAANATTVVPMSVERLTHASTDVVRAQAVESWSSWNAPHSQIFTYTRFSSLRRLKGTVGQTFVVKQMGGSAGGYTQHVAGVRYFQPGEEAVLFLHASEARDAMVVTGVMQGNFHVTRRLQGEPVVSNGVPGVQTFDAHTSRFGTYTGRRIPLAELESRVQAVAR